ncbi:MAG: discoidin domain-containing protein [Halothiobacillus sp.]|nr:discoidin domain-containing protein [Halothiobacillus sp.]
MNGLYQSARIEAKLDQLLAGGGASGSVTALPPGYIAPFMADSIPDGWVKMDGQALAIADYPALYALFADRYNTGLDEPATRSQASSLVPAMTSNTAPAGYVASASSEYSGYPAYRAFNGIKSPADNIDAWITAAGVYAGWLRIDLPAAKGVTSYSITSRGDTGADPSDFTLEGSNDGGGTWTALDTRSGETGWATGSTRSYELDASQMAATYNSIRLNITASGTPDSYLAIGELVINGGDPVILPPPDSGRFRIPNLKSSPADLPGSVWCVKAG